MNSQEVIQTIMLQNGYDYNNEYDRRRFLADTLFGLKDIKITDEEMEMINKMNERSK